MPACLVPLVCAFFLAGAPHPYTNPAAPMKVSGRHVGIGGNAYTNVGPAYTVTRDGSGAEYPVYVLTPTQPK